MHNIVEKIFFNQQLFSHPFFCCRFIIQAILFGVYAVVFFQRGDINRPNWSPNSHYGALTMVSVSCMFSSANPVLLTFPHQRMNSKMFDKICCRERNKCIFRPQFLLFSSHFLIILMQGPVFMREYAGGLYGAVPYVMSRTVIDCLITAVMSCYSWCTRLY